ncbi:lytic transglycosylase domain-containing protein [Stella sp.]|uniref:lytic murein transglycosylase n=1 Tax=Stella sp. TaxID=2912054 RepID=UPI0035B3F1E5
MLAVAAGLLPTGLPAVAQANEQPFPVWLGEFRQEALTNGISPAVLEAVLTGLEPIPRVIELDRRQPEGTMTFATYRTRVVAEPRIQQGRQMLQENAGLLAEVERRYGVPARFIVALWGIETSYGRVTGNFPVVASLATLAYDGRRAAFFRSELLNALRILQQGHITPDAMLGSWAGAMGQSQFMPSSFLNHAVDLDGDGRRDIWNSRADVLGSIANYLASSGWVGGFTWGREVRLPAGMVAAGADEQRPLAEWARFGVVQADGSPLPAADVAAGIVTPERDGSGPSFIVYENYRVLMRWNRSNYFALAVSDLADRIVQP